MNNHLIAKTWGKTTGEFLSVLSDPNEILRIPEIDSSLEFKPEYKPDEDEWFYIDNFSQKNFSNYLISKNFNTTDYNQIQKEQFRRIDYLVAVQGEVYIFQKVFPSSIYTKKMLTISEQPTIEEKERIVLNHSSDALYFKNEDKLYFRNIARIKVMFDGIDSLYREATQDEVNSFFENDFIDAKDDYKPENVKNQNRKRIAMIVDKFSKFTKPQQTEIIKYTQEYCPNLPFENGIFQVSNEEDLKKILYGIDERYYTTNVGREKRLANSIYNLSS